MKQLAEQFSKLWSELTTLQKGIAVVLTVLTIGFTIGVVVWSLRPDYQVLYTGLTLKESGQITQKLAEQNVDFELEHGGRTILVPSNKMKSLKVSLASNGYPMDNSKGYELFDDNRFGVTRFEQEVNLSRAKEAELARSIKELASVIDARVHLVIPSTRGLGTGEREASASVVITLSNHIDNAQIQAIQHIVGAAIDQLDPSEVVIVDSEGNLLAGDQSRKEPINDKQLKLQKQVEDYLAAKAQKMLDMALGDGNSVVKVTAELDFRSIETEKTLYDAENTAVLSEEKTSESQTGGTNSESQVTNFEVPMTVERVLASAGNIKNIKIATLVNYNFVIESNEEGIKHRVYSPRPNSELLKLSSIVKNAVGYDVVRGDQFEITSIPFDDTSYQDMQRHMKSIQQKKMIEEIAHYGIWVILAIVVAVIARKLWRSMIRIYYQKATKPKTIVLKEAEDEEEEEVEIKDDEMMKLKKRITEFAGDNPNPAADLVRTWLIEGE